MWLLAIGNIRTGFTFIGPFSSRDNADVFADKHRGISAVSSEYFVFSLVDPGTV